MHRSHSRRHFSVPKIKVISVIILKVDDFKSQFHFSNLEVDRMAVLDMSFQS